MVLEWAEEACRVGGRLDKIVQLKWGRCVRRLSVYVYERLGVRVLLFGSRMWAHAPRGSHDTCTHKTG